MQFLSACSKTEHNQNKTGKNIFFPSPQYEKVCASWKAVKLEGTNSRIKWIRIKRGWMIQKYICVYKLRRLFCIVETENTLWSFPGIVGDDCSCSWTKHTTKLLSALRGNPPPQTIDLLIQHASFWSALFQTAQFEQKHFLFPQCWKKTCIIPRDQINQWNSSRGFFTPSLSALCVAMCLGRHRWVLVNPNMDSPNSQIIRSHTETTLLSLQC